MVIIGLPHENKIRSILKDFEPAEPKEHDKFENMTTDNFEPPSYMIQILFLVILGFKNYGRIDKIWLHTYFHYKGYVFMIKDYKFGTWSIEGQVSKEAQKLIEEIKGKIIKASKLLDKDLSIILKVEIMKRNYFLNNSYHKLSSTYAFYEKQLRPAIKEYKRFKNNPVSDRKVKLKSDKAVKIFLEKGLASYLNKIYRSERAITNYSFALMVSFFSLFEFLLNVFYLFEYPSNPTKKMRWEDKFKSVFNVSKDKGIKHIYDALYKIKNDYRNPLTHGLMAGEARLLVPLPYIGLIPLSYEYLSGKIHFQFVEITPMKAMEIIEIFRSFLKYAEEHEPYKFYICYLNYNFAIPVKKTDIDNLKKEMTSFQDFQDYMEGMAYRYDEIVNREI